VPCKNATVSVLFAAHCHVTCIFVCKPPQC
jgi:hypothetical protein